MEPREEISFRRPAAAATLSPAPSAHVRDIVRDPAPCNRVLRRDFVELRGRFGAGPVGPDCEADAERVPGGGAGVVVAGGRWGASVVIREALKWTTAPGPT